MEIFLLLTKTSFEITPTDKNERNEILTGCLAGIIKSVIAKSPDEKLISSLAEAACLLYKMYDHN